MATRTDELMLLSDQSSIDKEKECWGGGGGLTSNRLVKRWVWLSGGGGGGGRAGEGGSH